MPEEFYARAQVDAVFAALRAECQRAQVEIEKLQAAVALLLRGKPIVIDVPRAAATLGIAESTLRAALGLTIEAGPHE